MARFGFAALRAVL
jgi:hypothetical protein